MRKHCSSSELSSLYGGVRSSSSIGLLLLYLTYISQLYYCSTTCVYLACKVDEFNVSLREFVGNLKKDREKTSDQILWFELTLMQMLNFHLTIHTAYRPLEGLFINLKVSVSLLCIRLSNSWSCAL